AGLGLASPGRLGHGPLDQPHPHLFHLRTVTVVPLLKSDVISNSSISRRVPGRPRPRPPEVEYPSCIASPMSGIPGPSSAATTSIPRFPLSSISRRMTSPRTAYRTIFLASSEIAVATTARSVEGNPHCDASCRPFWRAQTMSASQSIDTRTSSAMSADLMTGSIPLAVAVKVGEALFQVQRGCHALQREPQ